MKSKAQKLADPNSIGNASPLVTVSHGNCYPGSKVEHAKVKKEVGGGWVYRTQSKVALFFELQ